MYQNKNVFQLFSMSFFEIPSPFFPIRSPKQMFLIVKWLHSKHESGSHTPSVALPVSAHVHLDKEEARLMMPAGATQDLCPLASDHGLLEQGLGEVFQRHCSEQGELVHRQGEGARPKWLQRSCLGHHYCLSGCAVPAAAAAH